MADNTTASVVQYHGDINGTEHKIGLPRQQDQRQYQYPRHLQDIADTTSGSREVGTGLYQCADCQRRYSRPEHLARHVQTHTLGKRFSCPECKKAFARADLLKRHAANHTAEASGLKKSKRSGDSLGRVSHACRACAVARVKCEELKPCSRCQLRNIVCDYASPEAGSSASMHFLHLSTHTTVYSEQSRPQLPPPLTFSTTESSSLPQPCQQPMGSETQMATSDTIGHSAADSFPNNFQDDNQLLDVTRLPFSDFLRDVIAPYDPTRALEEHQGLAVLNFCDDANLEMPDVDLTAPGYYGYDYGTGDYMVGLDRPISEGLASKAEEAMDLSEMRSKCNNIWVDSPWRWTPDKLDHAYCEETNLPLFPDEMNNPRFRESQGQADRIVPDRLSQSSRDKLLAVVMAICRGQMRQRVASAFPSCEVLDMLLQFCFASQLCQTSSFIHHASLKLNSQWPEWIAATVAAGAVLTPLPALRKFGFALQETVRLAIIEKWENDNALTRNLHILQGWILQSEIGLWSANRRKMEISMAHAQPPVTMLRAAGKFKRSSYSTVNVTQEDEGAALDEKWKRWADQESYKREFQRFHYAVVSLLTYEPRLVFHMYLRDVQTSMTTLVNPIISYTEITLPLPHPRELWFAKTAQEWKQFYLSKMAIQREREPSLGDLIRNIYTLVENQNRIDLQFSALIYLHVIWVMIWEYRQFDTIHRPSAFDMAHQGNTSIILSSRNQELCQILRQFQCLSSWNKDHILASQETLVVNLLLLYLHVSLDDLQLFAGKEGEEQARKIYVPLQRWVETPEARQALWHAAQVLRAAKYFPRNHLKDFYAVAVHHASLALWTYGVVTKAKRHAQSHGMIMTAPRKVIFLDGPETLETLQFITHCEGDPTIRGPETPNGAEPRSSSVDDPRGCMEIAKDILRAASKVEADEVPPIVDNLCNLIKQLGDAALVAGFG